MAGRSLPLRSQPGTVGAVGDLRRYGRHGPVHADIVVDDVDSAFELSYGAGAGSKSSAGRALREDACWPTRAAHASACCSFTDQATTRFSRQAGNFLCDLLATRPLE